MTPQISHAQTRELLEQKRYEIIERIEKADALLKRNNNSQQTSLQNLNTLNRKIKDRNALINNIQQEIVFSEQALVINQSKNVELVSELDSLKVRYYNLLNSTYKQHLSYNKWAFILNAKSLNDSFQRWRYLKQYEVFCKESYNLLKDSKQEVEHSSKVLSEVIENRQSLLEQEKNQVAFLQQEEEQIDALLKQLKSDESTLTSQLAAQKATREKLNSAIENAIIAVLKGEEEQVENIEIYTLNEMKGKLQWPVDNGFVVRGFGKQRHPNLKNVMIESNGIDIQVAIGSVAYSVYGGKVVGVNEVPGFHTTVIVKHDSYYTVYSMLEKAYVEAGETVNKGDRIGLINLDEQGITTLHFEIWEGQKKQNPTPWLKSTI